MVVLPEMRRGAPGLMLPWATRMVPPSAYDLIPQLAHRQRQRQGRVVRRREPLGPGIGPVPFHDLVIGAERSDQTRPGPAPELLSLPARRRHPAGRAEQAVKP